MAKYKYYFIPANTICGHVNTGKDNQSELAIKWLTFCNNKNIQYISNNNKCKIGQFNVDGYDGNTKTFYELYGCYWQ